MSVRVTIDKKFHKRRFIMIREVNVSQLTDVVERLCIEANEHLPSDVKRGCV